LPVEATAAFGPIVSLTETVEVATERAIR
jgi:hypothetical protein